MSSIERMVVTLALGGALFAIGNTMLWLPLLGAVIRVFGKPEPRQHDLVVTATFVALVFNSCRRCESR